MILTSFDPIYFDTLPDKEKIAPFTEGKIYHTIMVNEKPIGIVGFSYPTKISDKKTGFIQIILEPNFRGKGYLKEAEDMLARKYRLQTLLATIKKDNIASIKAHQKAGFSLLSADELNHLRKIGSLTIDEIRLKKNYDF